MPATSQILMADTYFVQFFMRIPKIILFSRLDTPSRRASSAQVAWSRAGMWAACAELARRLGVSNIEKS